MSMDRYGFNEWAKSYDDDVYKAAQNDDWMFGDYDRVLDKIVDYSDFDSNKYSNVLDIGIGTGNLAARFLERGLHVIGIDPSEEMRKICRQKLPVVSVLNGDFLSIPLETSSVDLIVSAYAFHHLSGEQKERAILEMKRVLALPGRIVIADLMFRNASQEKLVKDKLVKSGKTDLVNEIEDEYLGLFDDLKQLFEREGFVFRGEQLTEAVWILGAEINAS